MTVSWFRVDPHWNPRSTDSYNNVSGITYYIPLHHFLFFLLLARSCSSPCTYSATLVIIHIISIFQVILFKSTNRDWYLDASIDPWHMEYNRHLEDKYIIYVNFQIIYSKFQLTFHSTILNFVAKFTNSQQNSKVHFGICKPNVNNL